MSDLGRESGNSVLIQVDGAHGLVRLSVTQAALGGLSVGSFVEIEASDGFAIALVTALELQTAASAIIAKVDLLGEVLHGRDGQAMFQRGVSHYPTVGSSVRPIAQERLALIYDRADPDAIEVGTLALDGTVRAHVNVDEMLAKHFALLGATGVGKSSGVALILREVLRVRPAQRIFLLDPHNEYAPSFADRGRVITPAGLRLPYWLFNFEEFVDAVFRARPGVEDEVSILGQAIVAAKNRHASERDALRSSLRRTGSSDYGFTVDTPVPYRFADLMKIIDDEMGQLEKRSDVPIYQRLLTRLRSLSTDPRYGFMFQDATVGGDIMVEILDDLFNLTDASRPMTVMQLAGLPAEVVDSVVSVLARMAFELGLWSSGAVPLLLVCEEAHRYAPADRTLGFGPTRKAISRIAKEGRKYGVSLGLVTQRPADLDPTIISQCSTLFAMRMANDRDQAIVRAAVSDAAEAMISFVPALGTREVFAFGEAVPLPTRIRFGVLPEAYLPKPGSGDLPIVRGQVKRSDLQMIIDRWRRAGANRVAQTGVGSSGAVEADDQPKVPVFNEEEAMPAEFSALKSTLLGRRQYP